MPNKTPIENVINRLPSFVQILPETYRGMRYPATFLDTEYNEQFKAIPRAVIDLQHGCKKRADKKRSEALKGIDTKLGTPIEQILEMLPPYLDIDQTSYKGIRYKARFYDKEYKCYFERIVWNVVRLGKGYCPERELKEFKKSITISPEEMQLRLNKIYNGKIKLDFTTYIDSNHMATFYKDEKPFRASPDHVLGGRYFARLELKEWKKRVLERDNRTCQICGATAKINTHHIYNWHDWPDLRFDVSNGITLCQTHHHEFHSLYGKVRTTAEQFIAYLKQKGQSLSELAGVVEARLDHCQNRLTPLLNGVEITQARNIPPNQE